MRILLVEDDPVLAAGVAEGLARHNFAVESVGTGEQGDAVLSSTQYDMAIIDIGLPRMDGLELLRRLRARGQTLPVMMLTARDSLHDRVEGLNGGADDYLAKPFLLPELVARVHALIRRSRSAASSVMQLGQLALDLGLHQAQLAGQPMDLTGRELDVLQQMLLAAPNVVNKQKLVDSLSRWDREITANAIEIYVSRLRAKLEGSNICIVTVRGIGYRMGLIPNHA
ncbi:response regulator transcription factor [Aquabacterium sp. CECT 9606]|uniref:response regulator n=1 Tax=Aquabacterium sp. CECT 9606 TaxID=2845822 RepID=UPI001E519290|nr:response regulator transcription factor [Aquabacterium sp. CECT 9606]CAH0356212.1 Transcriptional regulatory protein QseB [Aquabacterium sp. CECT 9606]